MIIPVYNVEEYLEECIESVIHQTIGFEKNIQMILVNDGSLDNSEEICMAYQEKYPDNILSIRQENAGVSAARNKGFTYATGKYVNFLDSDDKWALDAYSLGYEMLEANDTIDLVCFRMKFFERETNYHMLDYKFTKNGIIDIDETPENLLLHTSSTLIRRDALTENPFHIEVKISEDTRLLYELIFKKKKYGMISTSNYYYRKRRNETSAIQTSKNQEYWYIDTIEFVHKYLIDLSNRLFGFVHPYLQYFLAYDLRWRLDTPIPSKLENSKKEKYFQDIEYLLTQVEDSILAFELKDIFSLRMIAYKLKYKDTFEKSLRVDGDWIYVHDFPFLKLNNAIQLFEIQKNQLMVVGIIETVFPVELSYSIQGVNVPIETFSMPIRDDFSVGLKKYGYRIWIDIGDATTLSFLAKVAGKSIVLANTFTHFARLNSFPTGYYYENNYLFTKDKDSKKIIIGRKNSRIKAIGHEFRDLAFIIRQKKLKVALMRILYWLTKPFIRKDIWLFCDREFMAGDSGEIFFRYFNEHNKNRKIKTYFIVDKHYEDYKRMKQYGNVVSYHTLKYNLLFLHSKFLISSHADDYVNNAFGYSRPYYVSFYRFRYIYLTHGILLHDSSHWLTRVNKNFALNVTTSPMEYDSILHGNYYFKPEELLKTGIPRYDNLMNLEVEEENKILFMPSWRSSLVPNVIPGTQRREYNPKFKESEYYQFYDKLLHDERLLEVLKENHLKIKFCVHPSFRGQLKDFQNTEFVEFAIDVNSQYETRSSKFLVTDYSSAACDFAYLGKPVVYANFDLDHIYDVHYYNKGYFDYDIHGFGPNCTTYEQTLQEIVKVIQNGFKVEPKYKERMENFFFYRDNKNSERIYQEIMKRYYPE